MGDNIPLLWIISALLLISCGSVSGGSKEMPQNNLVLIMFDDLRPELSVYGREHMITPNFERLAAQSVVFDKAYTQIAVCNPARDSLLTGLRPDTTGTYGFQSSYRPHMIFPTRLIRSGYNTAGFGKILHWEGNDRDVWSYDSWENEWYVYQNEERNFMNSSNMPDKVRPLHKFRDWEFTDRAISTLRKMANEPKPFMLALGFKLPHLAIHVPYKYYEMYKGKQESWRLNKKELRFPPSSPEVSYRCCAEPHYRFMNEEGAKPAVQSLELGNINFVFTNEMHDELMMGYCAGVSFVDFLLGKVLDVLDELKLWGNTTVVLTADHGMHNGEKGIWEKWSVFDESTRVPLFISHPLSQHKGQHYTEPVETIDLFPTLVDLLGAPYDPKKVCRDGAICHPLQGKSLAPIVLGPVWDQIQGNKKSGGKIRRALRGEGEQEGGGESNMRENANANANANAKADKEGADFTVEFATSEESLPGGVATNHSSDGMTGRKLWSLMGGSSSSSSSASSSSQTFSLSGPLPSVTLDSSKYKFENDFAISQSWRCALKQKVMDAKSLQESNPKALRTSIWYDCDKTKNPPEELSLMGYSMRSSEFRYTAWFHYNRVKCIPILDVAPFVEELYDHRGETLKDFTHQETINLANKPGFASTVRSQREKLIAFIRKNVVFRGPFK